MLPETVHLEWTTKLQVHTRMDLLKKTWRAYKITNHQNLQSWTDSVHAVFLLLDCSSRMSGSDKIHWTLDNLSLIYAYYGIDWNWNIFSSHICHEQIIISNKWGVLDRSSRADCYWLVSNTAGVSLVMIFRGRLLQKWLIIQASTLCFDIASFAAVLIQILVAIVCNTW